ncbi:MAG: HD domain-containing phosphohydrolase [Pseudomonadota bacterium]|nr:HD domain-containing phosphohydrolase [Pseudomonadota bacterium]
MDYLPVRVSTLRGDQKIDFDAYVLINDKHILYLRRGDSFEGARLNRLKEKKLRKLYILNTDEKLYRDYMNRNLDIAYNSKSNKTLEDRSQIVQGLQQNSAEEVMETPHSETSYKYAKEGAAKYVDFLLKEDQALKSILSIENTDQSIAHHGVTVSTYAVALASRLEITDPKLTQMLSLGALLHDFAIFKSELKVNRPIVELNPEEQKEYYNHPLSGSTLVKDLKHFDRPVINIILEHEEFINGSGFPKKLRESQVDPLSVIVSTANSLDRLITFEKNSAKNAAKKLMIEQVGRHPLKHIQILQKIVQENY